MEDVRKKFQRAVSRFNDYGQGVRNSDSLSFKEALKEFYNFVETTDLIKDIAERLKTFPDSKFEEWHNDFLASRRGMGGKAELHLPTNEEERLQLLYHLFGRINSGKLNIMEIGYPLTYQTNLDGMTSDFVSKLFEPMFTLFTYKLQDIEDELEEKETVTRESFIATIDKSIHIYGDVSNSTIVSGDGNIISKEGIIQRIESLKAEPELNEFDQEKRKEIENQIDDIIKGYRENEDTEKLKPKISKLVGVWGAAKKKLGEIATQVTVALASESIILAIKYYSGVS